MNKPPSLPILLSPPLPAEAGARLHWSGLPGASAALAIAEAAARHDGLVIAVTNGEQPSASSDALKPSNKRIEVTGTLNKRRWRETVEKLCRLRPVEISPAEERWLRRNDHHNQMPIEINPNGDDIFGPSRLSETPYPQTRIALLSLRAIEARFRFAD